MTCSHCVGISFFMQAILSSSTTRKNKKKKKKVCIGVGVDMQRALYCGVCVRGECVTGDVWTSECVMLSAPSSTPVCVYSYSFHMACVHL